MSFEDLIVGFWSFPFAVYMTAGFSLALLMLATPKPWLQAIGKTPFLSPNWLSVWRLPLCWISFYVYFYVHSFVGFCMVVFGFALDRIDGKVAHALKQLNDPKYPGETPMGKWLDPLIDKLTIAPLIVIFGWIGVFWFASTVVMMVLDIIGTFFREPFNWGQRFFRESGATAVGKIKIVAQWFLLLLALPIHQGWFSGHQTFSNIVLLIAIFFGLLSILSRIQFSGILSPINTFVDFCSRPFRHGS